MTWNRNRKHGNMFISNTLFLPRMDEGKLFYSFKFCAGQKIEDVQFNFYNLLIL